VSLVILANQLLKKGGGRKESSSDYIFKLIKVMIIVLYFYYYYYSVSLLNSLQNSNTIKTISRINYLIALYFTDLFKNTVINFWTNLWTLRCVLSEIPLQAREFLLKLLSINRQPGDFEVGTQRTMKAYTFFQCSPRIRHVYDHGKIFLDSRLYQISVKIGKTLLINFFRTGSSF